MNSINEFNKKKKKTNKLIHKKRIYQQKIKNTYIPLGEATATEMSTKFL